MNAATSTYGYYKNGSNPLNGQELQTDGVNSYTYDANGNQITRTGAPGNYGFGYDTDNRLSSISGATSATYTYDYQGRRTSKTVAGVTTTYLYDGLNLVAETTGGVTTNYAFGPSIDEPLALYRSGQISYVNVDGLGSDIGENDASGTMSHSSIFDVWGATRTETGTRFSAFGHTGREFAEAGLWFYRARHYQSGVGRFTQQDPATFIYGLQSFRYVRNRPATRIDAAGLWATGRHNAWLSELFYRYIPQNDIYILMKAGEDLDADQSEEVQYMHAMAGGFESPEHAEKQWRAFVCRELKTAIRAPSHPMAMYELGRGLHALMDSTSPSHAGFQPWPGWDGLLSRKTYELRYYYLYHSVSDLSRDERLRDQTFLLMLKYLRAFQMRDTRCFCGD